MVRRWFGRDRLARRFVDRVRAIDGTITARIRSSDTVELAAPDGGGCVVALENLRARLAAPGVDAAGELDRYVRVALRSVRPFPDEADPAGVFPLLKPTGWAAGACGDPREQPLVQPLAGDLELLLVEDVDEELRYVSERVRAATGIAHAELIQDACANLEARAQAATANALSVEGVFALNLAMHPTFNAALALLPSAWRTMRQAVAGAEVVVALPERDWCLFVRADDVRAGATLRGEIVPMLQADGPYPLSRSLWCLRDGRPTPLTMC